MPEMELVKCHDGRVRGFGDDQQEAYEKFKRWRESLEAGECFSLKYWQQPDPALHRRLMKLFRIGFDHWDPARGRKRLRYHGQAIEKNFDQFRKDITIRAGYFTASYDMKGRVHLEPKSIAYGKMSDDEKRELLDAVTNVLLEDVLTNYTRDDLEHVVDQLQGNRP